MQIRSRVETEYEKQTDELAMCMAFKDLETGLADVAAYDQFIANVCKAHLRSPQILAFLFSVSPPKVLEHIKHNMLEELGLDEHGVAHPQLLLKLAEDVGFTENQCKKLETQAQEELRRLASEPLMYSTIKEVGFSALLETVAFEWMLSRLAGRMAEFLERHRKLSRHSLEWFSHHSEVDIRHAEEGLESVVEYADYYQIDPADVESILELTFRENVFIKRYFGEMASARHAGMVE